MKMKLKKNNIFYCCRMNEADACFILTPSTCRDKDEAVSLIMQLLSILYKKQTTFSYAILLDGFY